MNRRHGIDLGMRASETAVPSLAYYPSVGSGDHSSHHRIRSHCAASMPKPEPRVHVRAHTPPPMGYAEMGTELQRISRRHIQHTTHTPDCALARSDYYACEPAFGQQASAGRSFAVVRAWLESDIDCALPQQVAVGFGYRRHGIDLGMRASETAVPSLALKDAGIEVTEGVLADQCRSQNREFMFARRER